MWWWQNNIGKGIGLLLGMCLMCLSSSAQLVTVTDPVLNSNLCAQFSSVMTTGCAQLDTIAAASQNHVYISLTAKGITDADEVLYFKRADSIHLNNNKLTRFPTDLSGFQHLVKLNLAGNQLTEVPVIHYTNAISGDTALKFIYLNNNRITTIHPSWYTPNNLTQVVDLRNNQLKNIPDFVNYTQIRRLDISSNYLDFEDLIPVKSNPRWLTSQFYLFPQRPVFIMSNQELDPGDALSIQFPGTILPTNTYYLFKDSVLVTSNATGLFMLDNMQFDQSGTYFISVKNSNFSNPADSLVSVPFHLNVRSVTRHQVVTFSPNGDGIADVVYIDGTGTAKIINKSGQEILSVTLPYEWEGRDKYGKVLIPGLYYIQKSDGAVLKALLIQ